MLSRAKITTETGLLAFTPQELSKKLKATLIEASAILDGVVAELVPQNITPVCQAARNTADRITTGDALLDGMLGGGIRLGVVTELVGESASGKTQLALQVSLLVQLPREKGGLSGSACYLTTSGALQTSRLVEIAQENPCTTPELCTLDDIHTRSTSSLPELRHTLSQGIPHLMRVLSEKQSSKPLGIIVLDSMGALFRSDTKTSSTTLFERSRDLIEIVMMLHHLASTANIAVLIINEVNSVFERPIIDPRDMDSDQLFYSEQARWFSKSDSVAGEGLKEAGLGLVWTNQVGIRIMMTRTGRRKYLGTGNPDAKRRHLDSTGRDENGQEADGEEATLIRRISVIFSSFSPAASMDFVVTRSGIMSLADDLRT